MRTGRYASLSISVMFLVVLIAAPVPAQEECGIQSVALASGSLRLAAYLIRPPGHGPFPAVIWNHGWGPRYDRYYPFRITDASSVCEFVVAKQRWVYLLLSRRGYGGSEGETIQDYDRRIHQILKGEALAYALARRGWQEADDVLAATAYVKGLPYVRPQHVAVTGYSLGGIVSLFAAVKAPEAFAAVVDQAGGLGGWPVANDVAVQEILRAGGRIRPPILIQHGLSDGNVPVTVSYRLARALREAGNDVTIRYYSGTHFIFGLLPVGEWGDDFIDFLQDKFGK